MIANQYRASVTSSQLQYSSSPALLTADNSLFLYFSALSRYDVLPNIDNDPVSLAHKEFVDAAGWVQFADSGERAEDYRAVAFINRDTHEIVIAHRGTNVDANQASESNIRADYLIAVGEVPIAIIDEALTFADEVYAQAQTENVAHYVFHQTGFSLGGFLAGIVGGYFENLNPAINGLTISIDGPGTMPAAKALISEGIIANNKNKTIDYVIEPLSLVGLCNERLAREVRKLKSSSFVNNSCAFRELNLTNDLTVYDTCMVLDQLKSHNLNNLIQFVANAGNRLMFTATTTYEVRDLTITRGRRPLQIHAMMASVGVDGFAKGGYHLANNLYQAPWWVQLGAVFFGIVGAKSAYDNRNSIGRSLTTTLQEYAPTIQLYQTVLNNLHTRFGIVGLSAAPARTLRLDPVRSHVAISQAMPLLPVHQQSAPQPAAVIPVPRAETQFLHSSNKHGPNSNKHHKQIVSPPSHSLNR